MVSYCSILIILLYHLLKSRKTCPRNWFTLNLQWITGTKIVSIKVHYGSAMIEWYQNIWLEKIINFMHSMHHKFGQMASWGRWCKWLIFLIIKKMITFWGMNYGLKLSIIYHFIFFFGNGESWEHTNHKIMWGFTFENQSTSLMNFCMIFLIIFSIIYFDKSYMLEWLPFS